MAHIYTAGGHTTSNYDSTMQISYHQKYYYVTLEMSIISKLYLINNLI